MTRNRSPLVLVTALLLVAAAIGGIVLLRLKSRLGDAAAAARRSTDRASVVQMRGTVEHADETGRWAPVHPGQVLDPHHAIRTSGDGSAELAMGSGATLTITENTQCTVGELTSALHSVSLTRGRIAVDYDVEGKRSVRIEAGDASAESSGGRFGVLRVGDTVSVATDSGSATLARRGRAVAVGPGEHAIAWTGQPPSHARPLSKQVLLKAARVLERSSRDRACGRLVGRVEPGAEVSVDGRILDVDAEGRFALPDATRAAPRVTIVTRDAAGRTTRRVVECADARVTDFDVRWE